MLRRFSFKGSWKILLYFFGFSLCYVLTFLSGCGLSDAAGEKMEGVIVFYYYFIQVLKTPGSQLLKTISLAQWPHSSAPSLSWDLSCYTRPLFNSFLPVQSP